MKNLFFLFMITCIKGYSEEITIEDREKISSLTFSKEATFQEVIESTRAQLQLDHTQPLVLNISDQKMVAKAAHLKGSPRDYFAPVAAKDQEDIAYILRALANNSLVKLASQRSSLTKAGERIDHIHPLKYFLYVFSDEELKVCTKLLQNRSICWKEYIDGISNSLKEEFAAGNLKVEYLMDLAVRSKIDLNIILPAFQGQRWEEFITLLVLYVPRQEGSNRYYQ